MGWVGGLGEKGGGGAVEGTIKRERTPILWLENKRKYNVFFTVFYIFTIYWLSGITPHFKNQGPPGNATYEACICMHCVAYYIFSFQDYNQKKRITVGLTHVKTGACVTYSLKKTTLKRTVIAVFVWVVTKALTATVCLFFYNSYTKYFIKLICFAYIHL